MAKIPTKDYDDDDDKDDKKAAKADKDSTKTEQEKVPEGELPSQLQPYPTGGKLPERDVYGNIIEEKGGQAVTQRYPSPVTVAMLTPSYVRAIGYVGGAYGDDVDLATANTAYTTNSPAPESAVYAPTTQTAKAALPGSSPPNAVAGEPDFTLAVDITRPRGHIAPNQAYTSTVPSAPTITSLAPNTAVAGAPSPLAVVVTGTNFTPYSTLETGNVPSPYVQYESATKMTILMDPKRSSVGIVVVKVVDHGVKSAGTNFTYT